MEYENRKRMRDFFLGSDDCKLPLLKSVNHSGLFSLLEITLFSVPIVGFLDDLR